MVFLRVHVHANRVPAMSPGTFRFPFGQIRYVDVESFKHQYDDIFIDRSYEVWGVGGTPRIVDCGGNIGLSVIWFKMRYPHAQITAFEADPTIVEVLRDNLRSCGINDVDVVHAAVGAISGSANFLPNQSDGGYVGDGLGVRVPAVRLSEFLHEPVDILKVDIEGSEFGLIRDLCATGRMTLVRHIICEIHGNAKTRALLGDLWSALTQAGFKVTMSWAVNVPTASLPDTEPVPYSRLASSGFLLQLYAWQ